MPVALSRDPIYRGRRFAVETIELCVRWYLTYRLSYRDLSAMMAERRITVSHSTILRWVQRYVPEYERRWAKFAQPVVESWRMDETEVMVAGTPHWLYRAVDRNGKTVHSRLCANRDVAAAQAFFRRAVARREVSWPTRINLDGNSATHPWQGEDACTRRLPRRPACASACTAREREAAALTGHRPVNTKKEVRLGGRNSVGADANSRVISRHRHYWASMV
jgi:transposase-like protein